jgi:predicted phage tail protein
MTTQTIRLHGFLGKKYATSIKLDCANVFQVMSALVSRFGPQFKEDVRTHSWHVFEGRAQAGNDLGEHELNRPLRKKTLHLVPAVEGEGGAIRAILGIVLMVVGFIYAQPWLINIGAALALGGAADLLMKPANGGPAQREDERASKTFNGAENITTQGGPKPIGFGRVRRASSVVISTDQSNENTA